MANWTDAEVLHLIELWGEEGIQEQLEGAKRNKHVFEKIAKELQKTGSEKTAEQCRTKLKKLKLDYRKVKDKQNQTGRGRTSWRYFDAMDAVLAHRPTTRPSVVLDTANSSVEGREEPEENEEEEESSLDQSNPQEENIGNVENDVSVPSPSPSSSNSSGIKGKKRKRTKDEKIEAVMTKVVKEVVDAQKQSDKMFLEMEEKRMKYEADQRKEERKFQLRMMSMLVGRQGAHVAPDSFGPYRPFPGFSDTSDYDHMQ